MKTVSPFARRLVRRAARSRRTAAPWLMLPLMLAAALLPAWASGLQVSPILVEFAPTEQAKALRLTNTGNAPLRAQVRIQQWTQEEGEDRLAATRDVVASPAILEVAPGEQQLVRLVRLQPMPTPHEQTLRVIVDELPDESAEARPGLQFRLRYSIPLFVLPMELPGEGTPALDRTMPTDLAAVRAHVETDEAGAAHLVVSNDGRKRIRISEMDAVLADGSRMTLNPGLLGYVLAGNTMAWPLPHSLQQGETLEARINDDEHQQALPLVGTGR